MQDASRHVERESEQTIVITRVIDAPAALVFEAWTRPEHMMKWFGPPGYPLTMCEMDFRVGGTYRMAMTGPDGKQTPFFGGTYLEIVPNEKIVYDDRFEQEGAETLLVTVTFAEVDGKTHLTHHTLFASAADKRKYTEMGYAQGVGAGLDQLADFATAE